MFVVVAARRVCKLMCATFICLSQIECGKKKGEVVLYLSLVWANICNQINIQYLTEAQGKCPCQLYIVNGRCELLRRGKRKSLSIAIIASSLDGGDYELRLAVNLILGVEEIS